MWCMPCNLLCSARCMHGIRSERAGMLHPQAAWRAVQSSLLRDKGRRLTDAQVVVWPLLSTVMSIVASLPVRRVTPVSLAVLPCRVVQ